MRNGVGKLGLPPATWPEEGKAKSLEGFLRRGSTPPPSKGGGINYFPKRVGCGCSWALAGLWLWLGCGQKAKVLQSTGRPGLGPDALSSVLAVAGN